MNRRKLFAASCVAAALSATAAFAQEEPVEVRIRAVAGPDGKVEVVEERIVGDEKSPEKKEAAAEKEPGQTEEQPLRARIIRRVQELSEKVGGNKAAENVLEVITEDFWGDMPQSDYWVGVQIAPVAPEVRKHLPVKHGVLVVHVYLDSPAIKAALQADDILLQVGDQKIETGPDLVKAVDAAKETELSFLVLRAGKEQKLTVTPTKRAAAEKALTLTRPVHSPRLEKLQAAQKQFEKALEALRAETQQEGAIDFMLVRPGAFMASDAAAKMPDDLTVHITKEGNKPAKVQVKKGDKSWDTTSEKLDTLPPEIRPHVEHLLNGGGVHGAYPPAMSRSFQLKMAPPVPGTPINIASHHPGITAIPAVPGTPAAPPLVARAATLWSQTVPPQLSDAKLDQILKKLDALASPDLEDMKKELKSLRKEVDELRKKKDNAESPKVER